MKKAKIMLTTLIFATAIGATLAFKVRSADKIYTDSNEDGLSDSTITGFTLTICNSPDAITTMATSTINVPVVQTCMRFSGN